MGLISALDKKAGVRAVDAVVDRIHGGMAWEWDDAAALDTAVSVIGRVVAEIEGTHARMRAMTDNVLNLPDQELRQKELLECWMEVLFCGILIN
jgi:hypothetical protein